MDHQVFLKLFRKAVNNVGDIYYGRTWWNDSTLNGLNIFVEDPRRDELESYLSRYGERVYCYELYHQVRVLMSAWQEHNGIEESPIVLQGELQKEQISNLVEEIFRVQALDKEYIPDFLLHSPGDFGNQELVIEVKSAPELSISSIKEDLLKIQQFISRYNYSYGLFLTVNTDPDRMLRLLNRHRDWVNNSLPNRIELNLYVNNQRPLLFLNAP
jgi:hypothetical protein